MDGLTRERICSKSFCPNISAAPPNLLPLNGQFKTEMDGEWPKMKSRNLQSKTKKVEVQWCKTEFYQIVPRKGSGKKSTR